VPFLHKARAHRHEETVEDVERALPLLLELRAIESTTELYQILCFLCLAPHLVERIGVDLELLAALLGVESLAVFQDIRPLEAELLLEFVGRDIELIRREKSCFRCDCVVVLVDELLLVDVLSINGAFLLDLNSLLLEGFLDQFLHLIVHRGGLQENEGAVFHHLAVGRRNWYPTESCCLTK